MIKEKHSEQNPLKERKEKHSEQNPLKENKILSNQHLISTFVCLALTLAQNNVEPFSASLKHFTSLTDILTSTQCHFEMNMCCYVRGSVATKLPKTHACREFLNFEF